MYRRRRERFLNAAQYAAAKNALESDLRDAAIIQIVDEIILQSVALLESKPLRAADAIHVASALIWKADIFVSADARQISAAKGYGLRVIQL